MAASSGSRSAASSRAGAPACESSSSRRRPASRHTRPAQLRRRPRAGIYYKPGSLKARLCSRGRELLKDYCTEHGIAYNECGKLVVAVDPSELGRFDALEQTALRNGVPGLERVGPERIREIEPAVGLAALHSPRTAITDFVAVAEAMGKEIIDSGGEIHLTLVTDWSAGPAASTSSAGPARHRVDRLVLCAGLQADRLARLAGDTGGPRIVPFRGEYLSVSPAKRQLVRGMVYPVPDPLPLPRCALHPPRLRGARRRTQCRPQPRREGYRRRDFEAADVREILAWPGFWQMAHPLAHRRQGGLGSLSIRAYMRAARRTSQPSGRQTSSASGMGVQAGGRA